jgi:hypothetical protein
LIEATVEDIHYPCVTFVDIKGRLKDADNALADMRYIFSNSWLFLDKKRGTIGGAAEVSQIFDTTFDIMQDFIKTMKDDFEENGSCGAFQNFDLNRISFQQIGPIHEAAYGWVLYFDDEHKATDLD